MNCRNIESLILAERDGSLNQTQRAALSEHLKACPACRQWHDGLARAVDAYRTGLAQIAVPSAEENWQELQGRMNQPARKRPLAPVIWFGAPLAAAAAVALAFLSVNPATPIPAPDKHAPTPKIQNEVARADYVEAGDENASTMVYVDKDSGWLVVWATNVDAKTSG